MLLHRDISRKFVAAVLLHIGIAIAVRGEGTSTDAVPRRGSASRVVSLPPVPRRIAVQPAGDVGAAGDAGRDAGAAQRSEGAAGSDPGPGPPTGAGRWERWRGENLSPDPSPATEVFEAGGAKHRRPTNAAPQEWRIEVQIPPADEAGRAEQSLDGNGGPRRMLGIVGIRLPAAARTVAGPADREPSVIGGRGVADHPADGPLPAGPRDGELRDLPPSAPAFGDEGVEAPVREARDGPESLGSEPIRGDAPARSAAVGVDAGTFAGGTDWIEATGTATSATAGSVGRGGDRLKYDPEGGPMFVPAPATPRGVDPLACPVPYHPGAFSPNAVNPLPSDLQRELAVYRGKYEIPTQRPLIEWWRPLYATGILPAPRPILGPTNLSKPHFYVYGDYRTGIGLNDIRCDDQSVWAFRANLDMDLQITATERIHAFIGPLDRGGDFTRIELGKNPRFVDRTDLRLDNLFFEGDVGQIWGGLTGTYAPFDLPISFGFLPLFYQNGIWAADNVIGAAVAVPSRNHPALLWSNYDITFFWAADQVDSDAFEGDNNAAEVFGTAWFIDAYDGYIEADYAYVQDDAGTQRSYHNVSIAFTRRYFHRISNAIRYIGNFGQDLPAGQRTADGHLILIENSWISSSPNTLVPYFNAFYGQGRTQSLARAGVAGGILNNTGINFETDGLTGYPTLDPTAVNTAGGAVGVQLHSADFRQQFVVELAGLAALGSPEFRNASGDQYAVGFRYQRALTNAWLFRTDQMYGWLRNDHDIRGSRFELRWKF